MTVLISVPESKNGRFTVPSLSLEAGSIAEIQLPPGWDSSNTEQLLSKLESEATSANVSFRVANRLGARKVSWLDRIVRRRLDSVFCSTTLVLQGAR
jgi:hypothetical protein